MPGCYLIWVEAPQIAAEAIPGQFLTIRCGTHLLLRRPFSIHRINGETVAFLFAAVGQGTEWLANRAVGELLDVLGPLGNGFTIRDNAEKLLLIAGGIGVAPLLFLADEGVADSRAVKFVAGAATSSDLLPEPEIASGGQFIRVTEDGSIGAKGLVTDVISPLVGWADQVFACGPLSMYRAMAGMDKEIGNRSVQVLLEQVMGCGVGVCRGCAVPTREGVKLVCRDGPVFDLWEIEWDGVGELPERVYRGLK